MAEYDPQQDPERLALIQDAIEAAPKLQDWLEIMPAVHESSLEIGPNGEQMLKLNNRHKRQQDADVRFVEAVITNPLLDGSPRLELTRHFEPGVCTVTTVARIANDRYYTAITSERTLTPYGSNESTLLNDAYPLTKKGVDAIVNEISPLKPTFTPEAQKTLGQRILGMLGLTDKNR